VAAVADLPGPTAAVVGELTVDELAAAVAARLGPAELPEDVAAWVRVQAQGGAYRNHAVVGSGYMACSIETTLCPDGSIRLELRRWDGQPAWSTVVRPPSSTAPPAGEPNPATSGHA